MRTRGTVTFPIYLLAGAVVGLFSGMFGVGGGIIMVPFLVLVAGYTQQQSQAISLAAMVVTALTGAVNYFRGGTLATNMIPIAAALAVGSIPGAWLGSSIAQKLPKTTLSALFACFIIAMAVRIMPAEGAKSLRLPLPGLTGSMGVLVGMLVIAIGVRLVVGSLGFAK
jgi:hypothetical protein